ncbi:hypothetical protein [Streptomyces chryseus]|uniref:hypothetical protein n=1 Tax=Streptomyces chryseus TaxID=68186 RepID=UPI00110FAA85|nr:hypothetical protein [Streptomyces chryseus]
MTATTAAPLTPLAVLTAAAAVITARGFYQPASRSWEAARPTISDVEPLLFGWEFHERGDAALFARAATASRDIPAAVLQWCAAGSAPGHSDYRAKLARLASRPTVTPGSLPLLVSAVGAWQEEQRRHARAHQAAADAANSRHQGEPKERITRRVTVVARVRQDDRSYGYRVQSRYLIKMRDEGVRLRE